MYRDELADLKKRFQDIKIYRQSFADIEDCMESIEWENVKQRARELRGEFQRIYAKLNQIESQLAIDQKALQCGDISQSQFEKKLVELIGELSSIDLELDSMKPKVCHFIDKLYVFVEESGSVEDEKIVISTLDNALFRLLSEEERKKLMEKRRSKKERKQKEEEERKQKEEEERKQKEEEERKRKEEEERKQKEEAERKRKEGAERKQKEEEERKQKEEEERKQKEEEERKQKEEAERKRKEGAERKQKEEEERKRKEEEERKRKEEAERMGTVQVKKFCTNCGYMNENKSKYCPCCGYSLLCS